MTFVTPRDIRDISGAGAGDMLKWSVGSLDSSHTSVHSPAVAALGRAGAETNIDQSQLELQTIRRLLQSRRRPLRGLSWGENVGHCSELRHIQDDFVSMDFQYSKIKLRSRTTASTLYCLLKCLCRRIIGATFTSIVLD